MRGNPYLINTDQPRSCRTRLNGPVVGPDLSGCFRALAALAALAAWALLTVGGVVRVTESGLGCPDWPLCKGRVVPAGSTEAALEFSHRAVAGAVIVLAVAVAGWAFARYRAHRSVLVPATVAVALVPGQALLGAVVVWLELPRWMVGVHFVIGVAFLAATTLTAAASWPSLQRHASAGFARVARLAAAAAIAVVGLGAAVVAADADHACGTDWPSCNGALAAGGAEASLQVAHRMGAYVIAVLALGVAVAALRGRGPRLLGTLPLLAVGGQLGFGIGLVVSQGDTAHDVYSGLHVAGSGAVFGLLVLLAARTATPAGRIRGALDRPPRPWRLTRAAAGGSRAVGPG